MPEPIRRLLLLYPPTGLYRRDDRCQSRVDDQTVRIVFPPMDMALSAATARREMRRGKVGDAWAVRIADYTATGGSWEDLRSDLRDFRPDAVIIHVTAATLPEDLETARVAREILPAVRTIARGEVLERAAISVLNRYPELDVALWGEPEDTIARIVAGESPELMPGLAWRPDPRSTPRRTDGHAIIEDLDALPLPARDLLHNNLYRSPETGRPLAVIQANRGCPARCVFCPAGRMSGYRFRARSPRSIVEELRQCVETFGIREFLFNGDTFTLNKRWVLELCDRIADANLDIRWGCNSRVDSMDPERARALRRAGCWVVAFGVESGDQQLLDLMKKGARVEQAERAVAVARDAGLATSAFFLIGLPWDTRESLEATQRLARRLDTDFFDINIAFPLPGTELYDIVRSEGLLVHTREVEGLDEPIPDGSYAEAAVRTHTLSADDLTRWRRRTLLRLYMRPRYVARTLSRATRDGNLKRYARAGLARLRSLASPGAGRRG